MEKMEYRYFQYHTDKDYPVFLGVYDDADTFADSLASLVDQMNFRELNDSEAEDMEKTLSKNSFARLLKIKPASLKVIRQIETAMHSDRFGAESILPKEGYKVYRYRSQALIVYSFASEVWECGVTDIFGMGEEGVFAARTVLNRYLSWALAPQGIVGFWGVPVKEGVVVLKQKEAQGEAVFLDLKEKMILSMDGKSRIPARFKIMRLDSRISGKNIKMTSEELLSFLSVHTVFFDPSGNSLPVRQLLQAISRMSEGLIHPRESFQPGGEVTSEAEG
jgi:hypothetical protein